MVIRSQSLVEVDSLPAEASAKDGSETKRPAPPKADGDEIVQALKKFKGTCKHHVAGSSPVRGASLIFEG